ncbi:MULTISPECIES: DUF7527 domain-containing protein [Halomicrobium]|uniref:DUF7527 domain-containing protein n=2 Tax=Halomicrobium mukohataei TaxID=57705 RepID=C7NWS6_HALMD|nr:MULTISPECIES: hypothetical protein [Halomicrobium]ACV48286.1 conserved hypothetical protein [Halomicrobium mukohataei DSM 12286]QCD66703.1 hypothetical protein E5139_14005 [Halomicrobium mukohataei]QFR21509.1 hypothetical protein GBQ70_14020 [Halomicrobium sp. ZPS1]
MSTRTVEQIDSWDTVPFSGGYEGLRELADSEFSGVVAGPSRLFMLNGNVVGILDGSIEDFEDADGTARKAPHPGLPLLAVMQEHSDEVRAKYYTEDTPIAEVDQTLSSGGFTGYVELSENVLSGDYYQIYHQGRSMSVAWVGNSDQLVTEDEAFEQANDEVGIYEVRPVDIEIVDVPEPTTPEPASSEETAGVSGQAPGDDGPADEPAPESAASPGPDTADEPTAPGDDGPADTTADDAGGGAAGHGGNTRTDPVAKTGTETTRRHEADADAREQTEPRRSEPSSTDERSDAAADSPAPSSESREPEQSPPDRTPEQSPDSHQRPRDRSQSDQTPAGDRSGEPTRRERETQSQPATDRPAGENATRASSEPVDPQPTDSVSEEPEAGRQPEPAGQSASGTGVAPAPNDPSAAGAGDLETRSIPSLDPSHSGTASAVAAADERSDPEPSAGTNGGVESDPEPERRQSRHPGAPADQQSATAEPEPDRTREPERSAEATERRRPQPGDEPERQPTGRADQQSADTAQRQPTDEPAPEPTDTTERVAELEQALEETEAERDQLQSELDTLANERDQLQSELEEARTEIERLEQRVEELSVEDDDVPAAETRLSQREAIDQTNLFVRYNSKGDATLAAVHSGNADRSGVDDNLRLEFHTQFDAATAAVGDTEFETFLPESIQYRFVDWLVRNLLYEIRDTGNPEAMSELFDALPQIDRAELNGQIAVEYTEDGEQHRSQEQFDVVVRDRMGNPLIVANINDSRDPATDDMMTDLITRAERVGSSNESLAGAFLVTESFFEPPALETAEEATSSGLLSRDKRKSFVNLSRKDGYHLCLVEARNQEFHLAVPEL